MKVLAERARALGLPRHILEGEVVVRQGDPRSDLYFIDAGAMDVVVTTPEGLRVLVARLGPGSHFGEMSLLTGAPISADVVAADAGVVYSLTAAQYEELVRADAELLQCLTVELATRLRRTNDQLAAQQQRQADLGRLVGSRAPRLLLDGLPSVNKVFLEAVQAAAASELPLVITGETGVGKRALARHIAASSPRANRAVLVVDCAELPPDEARAQLFGNDDPSEVTRFGDHLGYLQAADGGTLILSGVEQLAPALQDDLAKFLAAAHEKDDSDRVNVRLIATTTGPVAELAPKGHLTAELAAALEAGAQIALRPLRQRRRDIIPLAESLLARLARRSGEAPKRLDATARRALAGYDYTYGNVRELQDVLRLAVKLAETDVIGSQHLFFGPGAGEAPLQVDLLRSPALSWAALRRPALRAARAAVALVFAGIVAACLLVPDTQWGRIANLLVWGLWWPVLVVSMVMFGRLWCAVCPLSTGAAAGQCATHLGRADPGRLRRLGPPLAILGFVVIMWAELISDMSAHSHYTAVLLIVLALSAALVGQIYQRHTWCRYLCPLGAMGATFTVCSALRVQVQKEVCAASCTGHECYKGSATAPGCPMFNHVLFLSSGQHCKLCMECLRSCPSHSPRLVLQLPLRDIWRSNTLNIEMAPLTVVVALMALVMAAARGGPEAMIRGPWLTGLSLGTVAVGWALWRLLVGREQQDAGANATWAARVIFAYAPVAAALLFAFHLGSLASLGDAVVALSFGGASVSFTALWLLQAAAGALGLLLSLWALWRVCRGRFATVAGALAALAPLAGIAIAYVAAGLTFLG
jgi:transcriptional regulator with AAA-type ATPase domain